MKFATEYAAEAERLVQLSLEQWERARADEAVPLAVLTMAQAQVNASLAQAAAICPPPTFYVTGLEPK